MTLNGNNVKHERKKLARLIAKAERGEVEETKVLECYQSWKAFASEGNSHKMLSRMDQYYHELWGKNYVSC